MHGSSAIRVWIDLANSPHVLLFEPVVERLRAEGSEVLLSVRDHAQTAELAARLWPEATVIGGESPPGRWAKARSIANRARLLRHLAGELEPDVALSHGSYAQSIAARTAGIPAVTMMDYEYQPANHLSFRLARRVIVPAAFPEASLRRFGARPRKVIRYEGFKEELYLGNFQPDTRILDELRLDPAQTIAVFRPPPEGALYHRFVNSRFEELLAAARRATAVQVVLLPRSREQRARYSLMRGVLIPERAIDSLSLLALADVVIGAGGTMNRESALLGTPTHTVFLGPLAAVDAELMRAGHLRDLRVSGHVPTFEKKPSVNRPTSAARRLSILATVTRALREVTE